jgi:dihydrodipicolinate reductase
MPEKDDNSLTVKPVADLSNPRETQSILAYIVTIGYFLVIGIAALKAQSFQDAMALASAVGVPTMAVIAYFFANKGAKEAAQAAQSAASA